ISSAKPAAELRQAGRLCSSFLTIMHRETRGRLPIARAFLLLAGGPVGPRAACVPLDAESAALRARGWGVVLGGGRRAVRAAQGVSGGPRRPGGRRTATNPAPAARSSRSAFSGLGVMRGTPGNTPARGALALTTR